LLKNPWKLKADEQNRFSTLVEWNTPIVRAWYMKESSQIFRDYRQPARAETHLKRWMYSATHSRLEPFKVFVRLLRSHLDGILA
jgi:transposase